MALSDDLQVPIRCPKCNEQFQKTLGRLKSGNGFDCPGCGTHVWYHNETLLYDAEKIGRVDTIGTRFRLPKE
jgi:hypothetical protein